MTERLTWFGRHSLRVAFTLVHFTVGFVTVLVAVSLVSSTRYRLTLAYAGGVWALGPDLHHLLDGPAGERVAEVHAGPYADLFFLHGTLDGPVFRANNILLTFLALAVLGLTFVIYEWHFGRRVPGTRLLRATDEHEP